MSSSLPSYLPFIIPLPRTFFFSLAFLIIQKTTFIISHFLSILYANVHKYYIDFSNRVN